MVWTVHDNVERWGGLKSKSGATHRCLFSFISPRLDVYECGDDFIDDGLALRIDFEVCFVGLPNDAI